MPTFGGSRGSSARSSPLSVSLILTSRIGCDAIRRGRRGYPTASTTLFAGRMRTAARRAPGPAANVRARWRSAGAGQGRPRFMSSARGGRSRRSPSSRPLPGRPRRTSTPTFQIRLGDVGRTWEVRLRGDRCDVRPSPHARARRRHRHRRLDLAGAARGPPLGPRRVLAAAPLRPRRPRSGARLRGPLPAAGRPRPAAADRRRRDLATGGVTTLIAGDGPEQVICLHGLGSNKASFFETVAALGARLHRARARPARLRLLGQAGPRRLRRALVRRRGPQLHGRDRRSSAPTWSATRWAAGSRSRSRFDAPERVASPEPARPGARLSPPPARAAGQAAAPRAGGDPPPAARGASSATSSGACSRDPSGSTRPPPTSRSRSSAASTARAPAGSPSSPPPATSTSTSRTARTASTPGSPSSSHRRCSSGATATGSSRRPSRATSPRRCRAPSQVILDDCGHVPQVELAERTNRLIRRRSPQRGRLPPRRPERGVLLARRCAAPADARLQLELRAKIGRDG